MFALCRSGRQNARFFNDTNIVLLGETLLPFLYETKTIRQILGSTSSPILQRRFYNKDVPTITRAERERIKAEKQRRREQLAEWDAKSLDADENDGSDKLENNSKDLRSGTPHKSKSLHHPSAAFKRIVFRPDSHVFNGKREDGVQGSDEGSQIVPYRTRVVNDELSQPQEMIESSMESTSHERNQAQNMIESSMGDSESNMRFVNSEESREYEPELATDDLDIFRRNRDDTMTPTEREIFKELFSDLSRNMYSPVAFGGDDSAPQMLAEVDEARHLEIDYENSGLDTIMELGNADGVDPSIINRYPPRLRDLAVKAQVQARIALRKQEAQAASDPAASAEAARLQSMQVEEVRRVEKLLRSAQTDVRLWEILDAEVLRQVRALKLDSNAQIKLCAENSKPQVKEKDLKKTKKAKQVSLTKEGNDAKLQSFDEVIEAQEQAENNESLAANVKGAAASKEDAKRQNLAILSKTYPALLLIAVRILCRNTVYTPLVEAILPAIKMIGFSSYVMGVSTPFYNEILLNSWRTSHTMTTMLSLLSEMDEAGITFDIKTLGVIDEVITFRHRAIQGEFGMGVQAVENMDERLREGLLLLKWKARIIARMNEAEDERVRRKLDERQMNEAMQREEEEMGLEAVT